jgi:hypothetical protein
MPRRNGDNAAMNATMAQGARTRRLAWSLALLAVVLTIAGHVLYLTVDADRHGARDIIPSALALTFSAVGALVASRQPRNPIGWMFLGVALSTGVSGIAHTFVADQVAHGNGEAWLVGAVAAYSDVSWIPFVLVPATFLLLLFPDGRLPSPRWRFVARCAVAGIVGGFLTGGAVQPLGDFPTVKNPFAVDSSVLDPLTALSFLVMMVGIVGSVASIVVRYRHAGRVERQQIKWLATAGAVVAVTFPIMLVLYDVLPDGVADAGIMLSILGLPVAAGVAILRYRLYDIDVVINRTLVYGALTGLLAGAYLGSVLLLQLVLSPSSNFAIAGSTLAVAALFRPARARIQALVDRRFFRRKYDAQRTLDAFAARMRDQVSLPALTGELRGVVTETMQPAHVSIWMRPR